MFWHVKVQNVGFVRLSVCGRRGERVNMVHTLWCMKTQMNSAEYPRPRGQTRIETVGEVYRRWMYLERFYLETVESGGNVGVTYKYGAGNKSVVCVSSGFWCLSVTNTRYYMNIDYGESRLRE